MQRKQRGVCQSRANNRFGCFERPKRGKVKYFPYSLLTSRSATGSHMCPMVVRPIGSDKRLRRESNLSTTNKRFTTSFARREFDEVCLRLRPTTSIRSGILEISISASSRFRTITTSGWDSSSPMGPRSLSSFASSYFAEANCVEGTRSTQCTIDKSQPNLACMRAQKARRLIADVRVARPHSAKRIRRPVEQ